MVESKRCSRCRQEKPLSAFNHNRSSSDGYHHYCAPCSQQACREKRQRYKLRNEALAAEPTETPAPQNVPAPTQAAPKSRLRDEIDPLPAEHKAIAHDEYINASAADAAKQKRQEYNRTMGHTAEMLHDVAAGEASDGRISNYISTLAEDERRFLARRRARSVSLAHARDMLFVRAFEEAAARCLDGKVQPYGYATKKHTSETKRITNLLQSDQHIGATLDGRELSEGFGWIEASRRLAYVTKQALDYKSQYRDNQRLNVYEAGDAIEGLLMHDQADGAPLTEQVIAWLQFKAQQYAHFAAAYPSVEVWAIPGNHGRNKLRHEGRATNQKWDSTETLMYTALRMMCKHLANVTWHIDRNPASVVPLFDKTLLVTHGDTHFKLGDPDTKGALYELALNKINGTLEYGKHIDLFVCGHFHKGRMMRFLRSAVLVNGALVPPNGHAKTMGYDGACGQWIWESVPGYALGDTRFLEVGPTQDADTSLDAIIAPFVGWET